MFKNERPALRGVTLETGLVMAEQHGAAAFHGLRYIGATAFHSVTAMRVMAIRAAHFAFQDRMMMRQLKTCTHLQVTLETCFRRLSWIDDRPSAAAGFHVQTPRSVARFAAYVLGVFTFCL